MTILPLIRPILSKEKVKLIKRLLLDALQLQLTITSAYYTYVLLLLKSVVYFAIFAFCLLRRTAVFGNGECSNSWWHKEVNFSSFILRKSFS